MGVIRIGPTPFNLGLVENRKTAPTGRATLTMHQYFTHQMDLFITHIRPALEGSSSKLLFPNREGRQLIIFLAMVRSCQLS